MSQQPIYLDYAATTPAAPQVVEAMTQCMGVDGLFANPASEHALGLLAQRAIGRSYNAVATLLGCRSEEIIFTSGATEANNLALKGVFEFYGKRVEQPHLITSKIEHKAVLDVADWLEQQGVAVTRLEPDSNGVISAQQVQAALRDDTLLVSIQHVNNELGVIQPIAEVAALLVDHPARLHVDAAQSVGKLPVDVQALGVDYLSLSAHKFYGPKGAGALYVRSEPRANLRAQIHGGAQQQGLRSGTLPTQQIVGMAKAAELVQQQLAQDMAHVRGLRQQLAAGLKKLSGVTIYGEQAAHVDHICNVSFEGIAGASLVYGLPHLMLSTGSACNADSAEASYVLRAVGVDAQAPVANLRISLGRYTQAADIDVAVEQITELVTRLRAISPWWQHD